MSLENEQRIRRLHYRLARQGMLELDVWLAPLKKALDENQSGAMQAIESLIQYEAPELLAMQAGRKPIPKELQPWLNMS